MNMQAKPSQSRVAQHSSPGKAFYFRGIGFSSLAEAACGVCFELFVHDYQILPGITYQIPVNQKGTIDFLVQGQFIEFHPPRKHRTESPEHYLRRRRELIDGDPNLHGTALTVICSVDDLYNKVIQPFSQNIVSSLEEFRELFWSLVTNIAHERVFIQPNLSQEGQIGETRTTERVHASAYCLLPSKSSANQSTGSDQKIDRRKLQSRYSRTREERPRHRGLRSKGKRSLQYEFQSGTGKR